MAFDIHFLLAAVTASGNDGESVFEVGTAAKLPIETTCVGKGTCGLCRVKVVGGEENTNPYTDIEEKHLGNVYHLTKVRLSCQLRPTGDVSVEIVHRRRKKLPNP